MLRLVRSSAVAGAVVAVALLAVPPLHRLTHELSQLFTAVAGLIWLGVSARLARGAGAASAGPAVVGGLALGVGVLAVHLVVDGAIAGCRVGEGFVFFGITWVPVAVLAAVCGTLGRRRHPAVLLGLGLGIFLLGVVHDLGQGLLGLRVVDPLLGAAGCIDQRASLGVDGLMLRQRLWLLSLAVALHLMASGRRAGRRGRVGVGVALAGLVVLLPSWRASSLGLGWSDGAIRAELDGELRSPRFIVQFGSAGEAAQVAARVLEEAEWQLGLLADHWPVAQATAGAPIVVRLYEDDAQVGRLSGFAYPHAWPGGLDLAWPDAFEGTLRHELVHVLQGRVYPEPFLLVDRAGTEGLAEAWEDDLVWLSGAHAVQASALAQGLLPHAVEFSDLFGFSRLPEGAAYDASASFFGWLVLAHGWEGLDAWHRSGGDARVGFGADLATLDDQWRGFLATVPTDAHSAERARAVYDPRMRTAYQDEACPKLGLRAPDLKRRAREAALAEDWIRAAADHHALFDQSGTPGRGLLAAEAYLAAGEETAAGAVLEPLQSSALAPDERRRARRLLIRQRCQAHGAQSAVGTVLAVVGSEALTGLSDPALDALRALIEAETAPGRPDGDGAGEEGPVPEGAAALGALIHALGEPEATERARLLRAFSDAGTSPADTARRRRVALTWGGWRVPGPVAGPQLDAVASEELAWLAEQLEAEPELCDVVWRALAAAGRRAAQLGDRELAARLARPLAQSCTRAHARLLGDRLERRAAAAP